MMSSPAPRGHGPATISVSILAAVTVILSIAATTAAFFFAAEAARYATGDVVAPVDLFGLPLFEGFRSAGRLGVHVQWGVPLMASMALAATTVLLVLRRRMRDRSPVG